MKLYNTLTRSVEDFQPLDGNKVRIYTCGPTVYDNVHIGNLDAFINSDTLRRTLNAVGFDTKHVMNLTDVDDKTIARSRQEFGELDPRGALQQLSNKYTEVFMADVAAIG